MNGFEEGVEFLPVNNTKKVEKPGPRRWVVLAVALVSFFLLSLMAGLLVWHFHCEFCVKATEGDKVVVSPLPLSDRPKGDP